MSTRPGLLVACFLLVPLALHAQRNHWSCGQSTSFMGEPYAQFLSSSEGAPYPNWNPAEEICPLQPTNAFSLAKQGASKAFPQVKAWELGSLSLQFVPGPDIWHYVVGLSPERGTNRLAGVSHASILVGLNGHVPEIKKTQSAANDNLADRQPQRRQALLKQKNMTPEELKEQQLDEWLVEGHSVPVVRVRSLDASPSETNTYAERRRQRMAVLEERRRQMAEVPSLAPEELKKHLESYQMELIRAGGAKGPPLPMPLSQELDDRLVEEGVLAPAEKATPMKAVPYVPKTGLNEPPQADLEATLPPED